MNDEHLLGKAVRGALNLKTGILNEEKLKSLQINVKTFKGVVQLSGFVDSKQNVTIAGEVARRVDGVKDVKNDLLVK